jgi:type IV pilus assembly protein PilE
VPSRTPVRLTLLEVATALVAAAVVAAIAVPVFQSHLLHRQRADAVTGLERIQRAEEQFYLHHGRYAVSLSKPPPAGLGLAAISSGGRYALSLEVNDPARPSAFTAQAAGVVSDRVPADVLCVRFSLDQNGLRDARDVTGADRTEDCWR